MKPDRPTHLKIERHELACLVACGLFVFSLFLPSIQYNKTYFGLECLAFSTLFSFLSSRGGSSHESVVFLCRVGLVANVLFLAEAFIVLCKISLDQKAKTTMTIISLVTVVVLLFVSLAIFEGVLPGFFLWQAALVLAALHFNWPPTTDGVPR